MRSAVRAVVVLGSVAALGLAAQAAIVNVPGDQSTIQAAIDNATAGDTINIATGTYRENVVWNAKDLTVVGAGMGQTIISGDTDNNGTGDGRAMTMTNLSGSSVSGITFTKGVAPAASDMGGGIFMQSATATFTNCEISYSSAQAGGGIYIFWGGTATMNGCSLHHNTATMWGGGLYGRGTNMSNCMVYSNTANYGGGLNFASLGPGASVTDSVIHSNTGTNSGGGMYINETPCHIQRNLFYGNSSLSGSAFFAIGTTGNIDHNLAFGNTGSYALKFQGATSTVENNTLGNNASGLFCTNSAGTNLLVRNNVLWGNGGVDLLGTGITNQYNCYGVGLEGGTGSVRQDPLFANPGTNPATADFHLKSTGGRWTGATWVVDAVTSPAIDAANPASSFANEPAPNGARRNMGVYGDTVEASLTPGGVTPSVSGVTITPDPAYTDDILAAVTGLWFDPNGDPEGYDFQWAKWDGAAYQDLPGETTELLDPSNFAKGDMIRVTCWPNDGVNVGDPVTDTITISNSPPTPPTVDVTPDAPVTTDDLQVGVADSTDADGDPITFSYRWFKDSVAQPAYDDLTTVPAAATAKGETWRCDVTPNDGTDDGALDFDEVTIGNTAPTQPTVDVTPDNPVTTDDLDVAASGSTDADGDPVGYSYMWYQDGVHQPAYDDLTTIPSSATAKGETWRCVVTPSDGTDDGPTGEDQVTIGNTPPTQPTVDVTPDVATTGDDLSVAAGGSTDADGDPVGYSYRWYQDGVHQPAYDDVTTIPSSATAKGETWRCVVTPSDGTDDGLTGEDQVTIGNTPPTQPTVDVTPDVATTGDDLSVAASGSTDADGDPVSYSYRWYKDGVPQPAYDDQTTVPSAATAEGETWLCVVTPDDGTDDGPTGQDQVTVGNTPPTQPTVDVIPDNPATGDSLLVAVTGSTDADGDPIFYSYMWYKDGVHQPAYDAQTTVPSAATANGEVWRCVVTPTDGIDDGPSGEDQVTVGNTAPTQPTVDVTPDAPTTGDDLSVAAGGSTDADGDPVSYSYMWYRDGVHQPAYDDQTTVPSSATAAGEVWRCVVTPSDGTDDGPTGEDQVTIGNTPPQQPTLILQPEQPTADQPLYTKVSGGADPDGDAVTFRYEWYKDGVLQPQHTRYRVGSGNTAMGETWRVVVTPNDGTDDGPSVEAQVTVNTPPPAPDLVLNPNFPAVGQPLYTKTTCVDPDGDPLSYRYAWYRDGVLQPQHTRYRIGAANTGPGETWRVVVTAWDGAQEGPPAEAQVTVNTPPTAPDSLELLPFDPDENQPLYTRTSGGTDPDGDPISYHYAWYKDGVLQPEHTHYRVGSANTAAGETWRVVVTCFDGIEEGPGIEAQVTVSAAAPAAAVVVSSLAAMPTAIGAEVVFTLSADARVSCEVLNIAGRPVRTLSSDRIAEAGVNTLVWNGQNSAGCAVPSGTYLVQLAAAGEDGSVSRSVCTVMVRR